MRRYENRYRILAIGLAVLAGFVDALGFLRLGGMFVSFMSGNSTRLAAGVGSPGHSSLFAGALIVAFVVGVMVGTRIGALAGRWRKQAVLAAVVFMLTLGSLTHMLVGLSPIPTLLMATAMGMANAVFQRDGEVSVGVTYMTGTLVKFGQHLTWALSGGPYFGWVPYLLLWLGLIGGAAAGAMLFPVLGLNALWIAVAFASGLLGVAVAHGPFPIPQT